MARSGQVSVLDHGAGVVEFSYGEVSSENREALQVHAREIRERLVFTAIAMIEIGERLIAARPLLPHGAWLRWLIAETGMSESWSRDCIRVYKRFHERRKLVEEKSVALPSTAFVRLAAAPEAAVEDVFDRVTGGEKLRVADVEEVIRRHRDRERETAGKGFQAHEYEEEEPVGADALRILADRARDELIPQIIDRAHAVLNVLEDAEEALVSGKRVTAKELQGLRPDAQWLTDALEQLIQRRAVGQVKVVHQTFLDRPPLEVGPWSDAAAFLRGISSSDAVAAALKEGVPAFVERGLKALRRALLA